MINNNDIHETVNQILLRLKEEGMTESSIKTGYRGVYNTFLKYLEKNKIREVSEEVCIQYIESKNQIRLPSLLTITSDARLNRRIRALVILLRYLKTGSLDLRARGTKDPFSCPAALSFAYEVFVAETEESHLAAATKSTIINSTQRFILSASEDGLADWGLLDMCYIDSFLSKYKDSEIKYRGTLLYGLKKYLRFLFDNGFCEIDYTEDILSLRIPRNGTSWAKRPAGCSTASAEEHGLFHRSQGLWKAGKSITAKENPTTSRMNGFVGFFMFMFR